MLFNFVPHDPGALFNVIGKQKYNHAVIEAHDAKGRQTTKRRDARSIPAGGTQTQRSATGEHNSRESARAAGVKVERNRRYDSNEVFVGCEQGPKQRDCPLNLTG